MESFIIPLLRQIQKKEKIGKEEEKKSSKLHKGKGIAEKKCFENIKLI